MSEPSIDPNKPHGGEFDATQISEELDYSKEDRDIAFAVEALESSVISERQLATALTTWTLYGSTTLAEQLLKISLLPQGTIYEIEQRSLCRLKELWDSVAEDDQNAFSASFLTKAALERMDESGRIAKLLGVSVAISGIENSELREQHSRYQLIRKLGQGGLGTVWLARDTKLQRYVALKEIRNRKTANKAALDRFRREAEITGRLEHPAIVPIYQLGEDAASGQAFYVMRFLGKQTLQDTINEYHERRLEGDEDPMLLRNLLSAFVIVCQAIGHAHSRKVIHRDLKPENVAIDNFGQVIVIDWGLAKVLDDGMLGDSVADIGFSDVADGQRTLAGQVLGSPLYMAPEQAAGRLDEVDESTDIFGLGAILFSILTGQAPHEENREISGSSTIRELITVITSGPTPRTQSVNENVDLALDAICAKAMAKKRYARYSSTTELSDDVQRWMAGEPVSAYNERLSQRLGRWIQHHQKLSQLIAAAVIISIVAITTLTISTRQNYIAAQHARFEEMRSDEREIEVQLISLGQVLSGDALFMSTLPPIQAIIDVRSGNESSEAEAEGEDIWRGRLETIYEGLMRANPDYLSVSYIKVSEEKPQEIVRVERNIANQGYIRSVPQSRLATLEMSPLLKDVIAMDPGVIKLSLGQPLSSNQHSGQHRSIIAAIPVFDEKSGDIFGIVVIEADLVNQLKNILNGLDDRLGQIYITDSEGKVLLSSNSISGVEIVSHEMQIKDFIPQAVAFFSKDSRQKSLSDGKIFVAHRVELDPVDDSCNLCIVQKLITDE
ncbi:serine/threonine-protein kinase [uncultured Gimesia sp.]|uniref:serine/threonine protein kinase n=1 Tax=uncultured Gimesia sp. TaxID=1678688 RepID=UPI002625E5C0|nr:serine/threonine-protein kinase [uncultured Gimesia sp.]